MLDLVGRNSLVVERFLGLFRLQGALGIVQSLLLLEQLLLETACLLLVPVLDEVISRSSSVLGSANAASMPLGILALMPRFRKPASALLLINMINALDFPEGVRAGQLILQVVQ